MIKENISEFQNGILEIELGNETRSVKEIGISEMLGNTQRCSGMEMWP